MSEMTDGVYEIARMVLKLEEITDKLEKIRSSVKFTPICPNCEEGDRVVKKGFTPNSKQRWLCKRCGITFSINTKYLERIGITLEDLDEESIELHDHFTEEAEVA